MKLLRVRTWNIGGLADGELAFPDSQLVALAGANGSGKSKLLSCVASPWTRHIPEPGDARVEASAAVTVRFEDHELEAQREYSRQVYSQADAVSEVTIRVTRTTLTGIQVSTEPEEYHWVADMLTSEDVQRSYPSLDFIHIPAERRLVSFPGSAFTLMSIDPIENSRMVSAGGRGGPPGYVADVLDDHEFENYARTLCIAAYLPDDRGMLNQTAVSAWQRFKEAVDSVLEPKCLLPLTQDNPSTLRIELPSGQRHALQDLSSGERQALIIISRVFRAGEGHSQIAIDEPDAYLHPSLCAKLLYALQLGVHEGGKLLLATHSPAILDSIEPKAIFRLSHGQPPTAVLSQDHLLSLYRAAGFRASAVTQSDLLLLTEGEFDGYVLTSLIPELKNASVRPAGGRDQVLRNLAALHTVDLPVLGVVDADVLAMPPEASIAESCYVWPTADIEGMLLRDEGFMQAAWDARLFTLSFGSPRSVQDYLETVVNSLRTTTVNEIATKVIRSGLARDWPSPRDTQIQEKLGVILDSLQGPTQEAVDSAFARAEEEWEAAEDKWTLVRGKYVLKQSLRNLSAVRTGEAFIRIVLARHPEVRGIADLRRMVERRVRAVPDQDVLADVGDK